MEAKARLKIPGGSASVSGPLSVTKTEKGYSASFKDVWSVNIKELGMMPQLANLSEACPQPHRVGLEVKIAGELAFIRP